jgi:hypothetical protein
MENQYAGKLFMRSGKGGHQFVMHYLDEMFKDGDDAEPVFVPVAAAVKDAKDRQSPAAGRMVSDGKVTDLEQTSRLWSYRGGRVPVD